MDLLCLGMVPENIEGLFLLLIAVSLLLSFSHHKLSCSAINYTEILIFALRLLNVKTNIISSIMLILLHAKGKTNMGGGGGGIGATSFHIRPRKSRL